MRHARDPLSGGKRLLTTLGLVGALMAVPRGAWAQGPPPDGEPGTCSACTQATWYHFEGGQWVSYDNATVCVGGTQAGWYLCADNPPYGPCTVLGACPDESAMISVPAGVLDQSLALHYAWTKPCDTSKSRGAQTRVVSMDSPGAAYQGDRASFLERLSAS